MKNKDGKTALMLAAEGGHDETVAALTQAGVRWQDSKIHNFIDGRKSQR